MTDEDTIDPGVLRKYELMQKVGKGAYGIVWKALSRKTNEVVALKKVLLAFQNDSDAQRTFREIMYLIECEHENIMRIFNVLKAENDRDIYMIIQFNDTDLHQAIKANILDDQQKKYIMFQILKALNYMHAGELLHRDIKPKNVLLDIECHVQLCDFGLCRSLKNTAANEAGNQEHNLSDYVQGRAYRCPEVLLGSTSYGKPLDIWAAGCTLAEMLLGSPLFVGSSTMQQLEKIVSVIGKPGVDELANINSPFASTMIESVAVSKKSKTLKALLEDKNCDYEAVELLENLLRFDPTQRFTAAQALDHPYFACFRSIKDQKSALPQKPFEICVEDTERKSVAEYRDLIYSEVLKRKKFIRSKAVKGEQGDKDEED